MKVLQNRTKNRTEGEGRRISGSYGRRTVSLLLCFCMLVSLLSDFGGLVLSSAVSPTDQYVANVTNRVADANTMDDYLDQLLSGEWGSRYAGRIWTDKSVFAYLAGKENENKNKIELDMETDGYEGSVGFTADFAHVFSALASSQVVNEPSPMDVMFVLDVSGSMGQIEGKAAAKEDFEKTSIYKMVDSVNSAVERLLELSPKSRFGIVVYGATAAVLVPLGHYSSGKLETKYIDTYGSGNGLGLHFTLDATVTAEADGNDYQYFTDNAGPRNNDTHGKSGTGNRTYEGTGGETTGNGTSSEAFHVGHITNPQAGFAAAMEQFIEGNTELTWKDSSGEDVQRVPAMIHLTDGQASDLAWIQLSPEADGAKRWEKTLSNWNNVNWKFDLAFNSLNKTGLSDPDNNNAYNASQLTGSGDAAPIIFQTLMTAAYYKSAVEAYYASSGKLGANNEPVSLSCFSIYASDSAAYESLTDNQIKATISAILNPASSFREHGTEVDSSNLGKESSVEDFIGTAYALYKKWRGGETVEDIFQNQTTSGGKPDNDITIQLNAGHDLTNSKYGSEEWFTTVDEAAIQRNINYVAADNFYATGFGADLTNVFVGIIQKLFGQAFVPLDGDNDAGVSNSITYQDPLGEYMEIKNQAIRAKVHGKEEDEAADYDMAMLVFGKMHGLVRAGVYDWNWNNKWMLLNRKEGMGTEAFPMGWYKGEPKEGQSALTSPYIRDDIDGSSTYPTSDPETGKEYKNAQEARDDGWVYRFNFETLLQFVPITGVDATDPNLHPSNLPDQIKNTVYTCYRFAGTQDERNTLHMNPALGTDDSIPQNIKDAWKKDPVTGRYPDANTVYGGVPGVYRLSDIRVWIEELGDYTDSTGVIVPNTGYDRSLYMNIPAAAVPTQLATITLGRDGVLAYQTNLATDKGITYAKVKNATEGDDLGKKQKYENYAAQSTPLRLFYAVGLEEDLILRDSTGNQTGVDFSKISPEYITSHQVLNKDTGEQQNYVWFISNYFSNTTYDDYVTGSNQTSRGDPAMTFSPSRENRYYIFQKALPLYAHAYRVQKDGTLKPVDNTDDWHNADGSWTANHENGKGNGGTTWESIPDSEGKSVQQSAGSWVGGEYMGTYKNEDAFKDAFKDAETAMDGSKYITDSTETRYLCVEGGIVFFTGDALNHVTSEKDGSYTKDSISFSSDDYFFLLLEYYVPVGELGSGENEQNEKIGDAYGGRMVQRVVARKGSEFGSAFVSDKINNGDMLCWTSTNKSIDVLFDYLSKTDTGDLTRGEPTFEKLTQDDKGKLRQYLTETCGITEDKMMDNPDYDPADPSKGVERIKVLDYQVKYWLALQQNAQIQAALAAADTNGGGCDQGEFTAAFSFCVAAKPGGIRSGNMANNVHAKEGYTDGAGNDVAPNVTGTARNYYVPVVSENSGIGDEAILNNYMGNNGYLEVANQMLHITKLLEAPEGFELTEEQLNEEFNYQIYVQGVTGTRNAIRTQYNQYGKVWERELAYIDVLTDNSGLVVDNSSNRALFIKTTVTGTEGQTTTAKQVIAYGEDGDGNPIYYEASEDGTLTFKNGSVDERVNKRVVVSKSNPLYFLYLPPNGTGTAAQQTRRLYQNQSYDGTADGYSGTYKDDETQYEAYFGKNGTTTFFAEGQRKPTGTEGGQTDRNSFRETDDSRRPAGTKTYWAQDAELIPVDEVTAAETPDSILGEPGIGGSGTWTHAAHGESTEHVALKFFTFVIRKPESETSETAFESPFMTRSQYMTVELKFGTASNKEDGVGSTAAGNPLTEEDLYDPVIPSADRPDLFGDKNNNGIAANTAEFTLKHGEGLLLSGLDNRITYRFTEKLTNAQLAKGYRLKEISHIQQRGSESIYRPGVQQIPVYTKEDSTYGAEYGTEAADRQIENKLTWKWDSDKQENAGAVESQEPFAHTNAIMWEYYATMAAGASGNHHQPSSVTAEQEANMQIWDGKNPNTYDPISESHTVKTNPNCNAVNSKTELAEGSCDLRQGDSFLHYMYYQGKLIDPHYKGEASTYLRNMARYGVSPTVRFGVVKEDGTQDPKVPATNAPEDGYYDYSGVYSAFGNTGWFEEQVNYINTIDPEMLVLTKTVVDQKGVVMDPQPDRDFTFTVEFTAPASTETAMEKVYEDTDSNPETPQKHTLYVWEGSKDDLGEAPKLDEYLDFAKELTKIELKADGTKDTYTAELKAGQAIVFYGLLPGTTYTVTEEMDERYPAVDPSPYGSKDSDGDFYTRTGTVQHNLTEEIAMKPEKTENRADFYDQLETGTLTVEKKVLGDPVDSNREFTFEVKLTPAKGAELSKDELTVTKKAADGTETEEVLDWKGVKDGEEKVVEDDGSLTATFKLKHGERITIENIPLDTVYTVREPVSGRMGYTLEHVANNEADDPVDGGYLDFNRTDSSVTGTLTETESMRVYLLFANSRATELPLSGGIGVGAYWIAGAALLAVFCVLGAGYRRKYGR